MADYLRAKVIKVTRLVDVLGRVKDTYVIPIAKIHMAQKDTYSYKIKITS